MDREELDRQLKEQGKNIELQTDKFSSGRKKLAAAAVVLLITSFIGGCFFGDIIPGNKQGNKAESSYSFPQTEQKKSGGAAGNQKYGCCTGGQRSWSGCRWDHDAGL